MKFIKAARLHTATTSLVILSGRLGLTWGTKMHPCLKYTYVRCIFSALYVRCKMIMFLSNHLSKMLAHIIRSLQFSILVI